MESRTTLRHVGGGGGGGRPRFGSSRFARAVAGRRHRRSTAEDSDSSSDDGGRSGNKKGKRRAEGGAASVDVEAGVNGAQSSQSPSPSPPCCSSLRCRGGDSSKSRCWEWSRSVLTTAAVLVVGWAVGYGGSLLAAAGVAGRGRAVLVAAQGTAAGGSIWAGLYNSVLGTAGTAEAEAATPAWLRPAPSEGGEYWVYLPPLAQWNGAAWPYTWPGTALEGVAAEGAYSQAAGLEPCPPHDGNALVVIATDAVVDSPMDAASAATATAAVAVIPEALAARYTLGGRMATAEEYFNDVAWGKALAKPIEYNLVDFAGMRDDALAGRTRDYTSTDEAMHKLLARHPTLLEGARVVVMGSVVPWYEAMAFARGATEVLTVEYGPRTCEYPNLYFATPAGVADCTLDFDVGFSISSFEHDGLGRYGDKLLPEADLLAMRAMKHLVRPGGYLLFAVPTGLDTIVFNAHRVYGHVRWQLMTAGWEIVDYAGTSSIMWAVTAGDHMQPAWLLRNTPYLLPA